MTTSTAPTTARPDTSEMVVVHNVFRRLFGDLPGLLRAAPPGDHARAGVLADLYTEVATALDHHHTAEDELLHPVLLERVHDDRPLVLRGEEQHERVHELLALAAVQVERFRSSASAADRDAFADTAVALDAALREHMADEERVILPLVETHLSVAEWERLGERGRAGIPKDRLLIQIGWILDGTSAAEQREFLSHLPVMARIAWRLIGRRRWARERDRVYGVGSQPG